MTVDSVVATHRLWSSGSVVETHGLSCSAACDLPGPGVEPMSPALVDRFFFFYALHHEGNPHDILENHIS